MTKYKTDNRPFCPYCNIAFDDPLDAELSCQNATEASSCRYHPSQRPKAKLQVVGEDFERIEDSPVRLGAMQSLINDGAAWHPDIDADGHTGRQANDLIARKLCKPPRSDSAKHSRHLFDVALCFGLEIKRSAS